MGSLAIAAPVLASTTVSLTPTGVIAGGGNLYITHHSVTNVHGFGYSDTTCVTAVNDDGSIAGSPDCEPPGWLANHDYNGTLRRGFIWPYSGVSETGSGFETYG